MKSADPAAPAVPEFAPAGLKELLFQIDNTFHARVNIFLVAESVFFAALAQVWADGDFGINLILCVLGIALTCLLWQATRVLAARSRWLAGELRERDRLYDAYLKSISVPLNVTHRLANVVPAIFLAGWLAVLVLLVGKTLVSLLARQ